MRDRFNRRMLLRAWIPAALGIALILTVTLVAIFGRGSSTSASTVATVTRTTDNYRLGVVKDAVRGKVAPGLAVDPADANHIVEVQGDVLAGFCQFNTSTDGGKKWTAGNLKSPSGYSQTPCSFANGQGIYPQVVFGSGQNVYAPLNSPSDGGTGNHAALVARSTDGGQTFPAAQIAMKEGQAPPVNKVNPGPNYTRVTVAVQAGAGANGADRLVLAAIDNGCKAAPCAGGNMYVVSSDDAGSSWSAPVQVNTPFDATSQPFGVTEATQVAIANGRWYVGWRTKHASTASAQDPKTAEGFIRMGMSSDQGKTWTQTDVTPIRGFVYTGPVTKLFSKTPTAYDSSNFPRLTADPASGHLYLTWNQGLGLYDPTTGKLLDTPYTAADHFINPQSAVWFMSSTDGTTWGGRRQVNESPVAGQPVLTRQPNISVAKDGRIDIVWHDRREAYNACLNAHVACTEERLGDTYAASSTDGGKTFSANRRITDRTMSVDVGYDSGGGSYWSYGPVVAPMGPGQFMVAWMDSREGSYDTQNQDIYLAVAPVAASGNIPVTVMSASTGDDLSATLSQFANPGGSEDLLRGNFAVAPATSVVIANDKDAASILAGGVLARANVGPLLISPPSGLPSTVSTEVKRLHPVGAYVIGDTTQLSSQVESDLAAAGVPAAKVTRISGGSAAATAALIATQLDRRSATDKAAALPAFDTVIIAKAGSPDAAAASTLAVNRRMPILYVDTSAIPPETSSALAALKVNKALVIGGPSVVDDTVMTTLSSAGVTPTRLGGADAEATSAQVAKESLKRGLPANQVFVADGETPLQGALLGASTGRVGGVLVLTHGGSTSEALSMVNSLGIDSQVARLVASNASSW